ncbi:SGNH/GDSL hydrolase family protein [Marisediminicola sp. LYQ134]|uniref:SGNH/GDSL hydrolase family protein n=1 Tax=Marisediminicola sp. LYQ134 TaxID=3391061 RepID=UPI003983C621
MSRPRRRATFVAIGTSAAIGTAALGTAAVVGRSLVLRRRTAGVSELADKIPEHSAYWRDQRRKGGELLYVALGDSAAQGIGGSRPNRSYVGLLAKTIRAASGRTVRVANLSQSGARLRDAIEKQVPALAKLSPDIVTVSIGANDIASFERDRFERELRYILDALPATAIVADLPSFYLGEFERRVLAANEIVRRVAAEHGYAVAPLHSTTRGRTAARTALRDVAKDFFHPNDRGYAVWASAFEPLVRAAVGALVTRPRA